MITNKRNSWLLNIFSLWAPKEMYREHYGENAYWCLHWWCRGLIGCELTSLSSQLCTVGFVLTFKKRALVFLSLPSASKIISGSLMANWTTICGGSSSVFATVTDGCVMATFWDTCLEASNNVLSDSSVANADVNTLDRTSRNSRFTTALKLFISIWTEYVSRKRRSLSFRPQNNGTPMS